MSDYSVISFPSFGISIDPSRGFSLGPLDIRWYGMLIAIGLSLAVVYACCRSKKFGLNSDDIIDGVLCIVPFAVI